MTDPKEAAPTVTHPSILLKHPETDEEKTEYLMSPAEWLRKNMNTANPIYPLSTILASRADWTDVDLMAHLAVTLDEYTGKLTNLLIEQAKTLGAAGRPAALRYAITVAGPLADEVTCKFHGGEPLEPGTACPACVEHAVENRPEHLTEEEARAGIRQNIVDAVAEMVDDIDCQGTA